MASAVAIDVAIVATHLNTEIKTFLVTFILHLFTFFLFYLFTFKLVLVKPDFLFPNTECYHNFEFPAEDLTVLGAKTTCKDRWRQVTTEADRVDEKYLFTLQPGISRNQLKEMAAEKVLLVVPESHIKTFPEEYQGSIGTLSTFINMVKEKQSRMPKHFLVRRGNKTVVDTIVQVEEVTEAQKGQSKVEINITNNFHEKVDQVVNNNGGKKK